MPRPGQQNAPGAGFRAFAPEHRIVNPATAPDNADTPQSPPPLSLAGASAACGVSAVTLRKHLAAGRLRGVKRTDGRHGATWAIAPADLAAFVGAQYGRPLDFAALPREPAKGLAPLAALDTATRQAAEARAVADELRARLDVTLEELGRYKALTAAAAEADARVKTLLGERIAEVSAERDAARADLAAELARP
jgi:hypothetical protein